MSVASVSATILEALTPKGQPVFEHRESVSPSELAKAEASLGMVFPDSYRLFLTTCGAGAFFGELRFFAPGQIRAFEFVGVPWLGFLAIATDELGNYLAFDPKEAAIGNEQPVYYVCHDPFGFARLSPNFESFLGQLSLNGFRYFPLVESPIGFTEVEFPKVIRHTTRPWWRFW